MYYVIDCHTNVVVAKFKSYRRAIRKADQLDLAYGAVRYVVKKGQV